MSQTLEMYHFNPVKFGLICRQMAKEKRISQAVMAARTGLSYDTVGNIYAGRVQKIPFEYVFKICVVLEVSVEVMTLLMLKDDDIAFRDKILTYDTHRDEEIPVPEVLPSMTPGVVSDVVTDTAVAVASAAPVLDSPAVTAETSSGLFAADDIQTIIDNIKADYESRIRDLKEQVDFERRAAAMHAEQMHSLAMGILKSREVPNYA